MTSLDQVREALEASANELESVPHPFSPEGRFAIARRCRAALSLLPSLTEGAREWDHDVPAGVPNGWYWIEGVGDNGDGGWAFDSLYESSHIKHFLETGRTYDGERVTREFGPLPMPDERPLPPTDTEQEKTK